MMPEPQIPVTPMRGVASAKPGSSDHRSQPITLKRGSRVARIDPHPLDRARRGALAAADLRALERRPGRRRGGEQALAVAEHDLGIGADVDDQRHLVGEVRRLGQDHAGGVGADMAGDAGQHVDPGVGMHASEVELARPERHRLVGGERERRAAELGRIDAEQQVMHDRIADEGQLQDVARRRPAPAAATWSISAPIASRTARVISASPPGFIMT